MLNKNLPACLILLLASLCLLGCGDPNAEFQPDSTPVASPKESARDGTANFLPGEDGSSESAREANAKLLGK